MTDHVPAPLRTALPASGNAAVCWGELLWDLLPQGEHLGGCAANVSYHLAALGQPTALVSRVGCDERGDRAIDTLQGMGVDVSLIQRDASAQTGAVDISFINGEPSYRIRQRVAWDRIVLTAQVQQSLSQASAFVFGTLAQRSEAGQVHMREAWGLLPPSALKVCDLNLRQSPNLKSIIQECIANSDVLKLNAEETAAVGAFFDTKEPLRWLLENSTAKIVVQTLGEHGCRVLTPKRDLALSIQADPGFLRADNADPVGAGDAFTARLVRGLVNTESLGDAARAANRYAARVANLAGATPRRALLLLDSL